MKVWLIWLQGDEHTWLEAAWDDEMTAQNNEGWKAEVARCRKLALDDGYEFRIQAVEIPGVYKLFEVPVVRALGMSDG